VSTHFFLTLLGTIVSPATNDDQDKNDSDFDTDNIMMPMFVEQPEEEHLPLEAKRLEFEKMQLVQYKQTIKGVIKKEPTAPTISSKLAITPVVSGSALAEEKISHMIDNALVASNKNIRAIILSVLEENEMTKL
jgi:tRNA G37 N-methylase Trm5